jgi:hypothetical protein
MLESFHTESANRSALSVPTLWISVYFGEIVDVIEVNENEKF